MPSSRTGRSPAAGCHAEIPRAGRGGAPRGDSEGGSAVPPASRARTWHPRRRHDPRTIPPPAPPRDADDPIARAAATRDDPIRAGPRTARVEGQKRAGAGARKIAEETETFKVQRAGLDFGKALMQARTAKKLSQKDLGTKINEKPQVVQQYECGKAVPNPQIISKLERALGTKLPRPKKVKAPKD